MPYLLLKILFEFWHFFDAASFTKAIWLFDNFDIFNALIQAAANDFIFFNLDEESETINWFLNDPYKLIYNPKAAEEEDDDDEEDIEIVDDDTLLISLMMPNIILLMTSLQTWKNHNHNLSRELQNLWNTSQKTSSTVKNTSRVIYFDKVTIREKIFYKERDIENELKGIEIAKGMAKECQWKEGSTKGWNEAFYKEKLEDKQESS